MQRQRRGRSIGPRLELSSAGGRSPEALAIRLMSLSIAATAVITAVRAAIKPRMAAERPATPSLALRALSMKAAVSARGSRTPNTMARPRIWFSKVTRWPTSFLRALINERMACAGERLHVHGLEEPGTGQMRQPSCVIAIGLVGRQRLERLIGLSAFDADYGQTELNSTRETGSAPFVPSRIRCDDNLALSPTHRRSPPPSTSSCFREPPRLRDRERKHASHPLRYRGQQNSPCRFSSSTSGPIVPAFAEELPPITRC